jgi:hypothetical protein
MARFVLDSGLAAGTLTESPITGLTRRFEFAAGLYLESFGEDCLLLVARRNLLLTINAAAADLFEGATQTFFRRSFTLTEGIHWLAGGYDLSAADSRTKARELLTFGLKHGLVCRAGGGNCADE